MNLPPTTGAILALCGGWWAACSVYPILGTGSSVTVVHSEPYPCVFLTVRQQDHSCSAVGTLIDPVLAIFRPRSTTHGTRHPSILLRLDSPPFWQWPSTHITVLGTCWCGLPRQSRAPSYRIVCTILATDGWPLRCVQKRRERERARERERERKRERER